MYPAPASQLLQMEDSRYVCINIFATVVEYIVGQWIPGFWLYGPFDGARKSNWLRLLVCAAHIH